MLQGHLRCVEGTCVAKAVPARPRVERRTLGATALEHPRRVAGRGGDNVVDPPALLQSGGRCEDLVDGAGPELVLDPARQWIGGLASAGVETVVAVGGECDGPVPVLAGLHEPQGVA